MPRAATVCGEAGCWRAATAGGRCPVHQRKRQRPTTTEQGYGWRYQRKRAAFLRTHPTCEMCGQRPATTIHHTRHDAVTEQGLDARYWQAACVHCNCSEGARWGGVGGLRAGA